MLRTRRFLVGLAIIAWSGWFLAAALQRWRFERVCSMVCGPFVPVELVEHYRRAFDWQTPLLAASLPLAALIGYRIALRLSVCFSVRFSANRLRGP